MLELRNYQDRSLQALEEYLINAVTQGAKIAFIAQTDRPYRSITQLPDLPYVCLRVPTGGGKTLMACHALGITSKAYIHLEHALCLWLVPSNAIREQTLAALRDRNHPYRQAIDSYFMGQVRVMDLAEALYIQRNVLEGETCIIITTLQALRRDETEGLKVYESSGALTHHFSGLSASLETLLEKDGDGVIAHSLANVLRLWRPIVIIDEAHNARTKLSFDSLARFNPSCIIEFSATPEVQHEPEKGLFASNVLHHVSAAELKAEDMVKLPIKLSTRTDWREAVSDAIAERNGLEDIAKGEETRSGEYIRPIVLIQAQSKNKEKETVSVEVIHKALIDDFKIPTEHVAIATGETRGIEDVDLFDRSCPIRYIITVQALKEGWDCSFAYILCTVSNVATARSVEQILGRILRLPHAKRKENTALDCAYAFTTSQHFAESAVTLRDALIENGFQKIELDDLVTSNEAIKNGDLFASATEVVTESPDLSKLVPSIKERVKHDIKKGTITVTGHVSAPEAESLKACFKEEPNWGAVERIVKKLGGAIKAAEPSVKYGPFQVPCIAIRVEGQLEIFDESHFLDTKWNIAENNSDMPEDIFPSQVVAGETGLIDVSASGKVEITGFSQQLYTQMEMLKAEPGWTVAALANWLDRQVLHPDIPINQSSLYIHKVIDALIEKRKLTVEQLARLKYRLKDAIAKLIDKHRGVQATQAFQECLFKDVGGVIEVSPDLCFGYDESRYSPNWYYEGGYVFQKHYFPKKIGELKPEGEEFECAQFIDIQPEVKFWVRNLERRQDASFWFQTSTDKFYPDFVALLQDGRYLVIEYKGEHLWSADDAKEKMAVGKLWADRSKGKCLFIMPKGKDWESIRSVINSRLKAK